MQTPSGARAGSESSSRARMDPFPGHGSGSILLLCKGGDAWEGAADKETGASLLLQAAPGGDL